MSNDFIKTVEGMDPEFKFASARISGISENFAHLLESAKAMEMPLGMGTLATLATAMTTSSATLTAAVGIGAAINGMFSGNKKETPKGRQ
ncbi:MAG: hypothetical protein SFW64_02125 [Alphaproteobacteria bacterium]|nr:hypothetical protein [Alphaproteobacteria bacterium]